MDTHHPLCDPSLALCTCSIARGCQLGRVGAHPRREPGAQLWRGQTPAACRVPALVGTPAVPAAPDVPAGKGGSEISEGILMERRKLHGGERPSGSGQSWGNRRAEYGQ